MKKDNKIEILKNPPLPKQIIESYEKNELVVFVGAGISRLQGCEGWSILADNLIKTLFSPAEASLATI